MNNEVHSAFDTNTTRRPKAPSPMNSESFSQQPKVKVARISFTDLGEAIHWHRYLHSLPYDGPPRDAHNCRHCWGAGHRFQFHNKELDRFRSLVRKRNAMRDLAGLKPLKPNEKGGGGHLPKREPNPKCPVCKGYGSRYLMSCEKEMEFEGPPDQELAQMANKKFMEKLWEDFKKQAFVKPKKN